MLFSAFGPSDGPWPAVLLRSRISISRCLRRSFSIPWRSISLEANLSRIVVVFGGSGFLGRYIARRLAKDGERVRVAVRNPNEAIFVRPYGVPGQVEPVLANVRYESSVRESVRNADAVVNCVGILAETRRQKFDSVHSKAAGHIAAAAAEEGAESLVHVSAIGADMNSPSAYARSKAAGEDAARSIFSNAVILRPSVIFGAEDQFFNRFGSMARRSLVIPLVGAETRFQPVYVDDVARAAVSAVNGEVEPGIYELGGPDMATFRELVHLMLRIVRRRRIVLGLPAGAVRPMAAVLDFCQAVSGDLIKNKILTLDQIRQLAKDNVVGGEDGTFADFGIDPIALESILDEYLYSYRPAGQYTSIHESAMTLGVGAADVAEQVRR